MTTKTTEMRSADDWYGHLANGLSTDAYGDVEWNKETILGIIEAIQKDAIDHAKA